jgi:hypothetical protein
MPYKGQTEPPICKKCNLQHWHFRPCSDGRKYVRVGYDTLNQETGYRARYGRVITESDYSSRNFSTLKKRTYYTGDDEAA